MGGGGYPPPHPLGVNSLKILPSVIPRMRVVTKQEPAPQGAGGYSRGTCIFPCWPIPASLLWTPSPVTPQWHRHCRISYTHAANVPYRQHVMAEVEPKLTIFRIRRSWECNVFSLVCSSTGGSYPMMQWYRALTPHQLHEGGSSPQEWDPPPPIQSSPLS